MWFGKCALGKSNLFCFVSEYIIYNIASHFLLSLRVHPPQLNIVPILLVLQCGWMDGWMVGGLKLV